jgi:hypothetical protein
MPALAKKMTKAELDAVYLASFAASCSLSNDWKLLENEILLYLHHAEARGQKLRRKTPT